jgi:hypothetical protein
MAFLPVSVTRQYVPDIRRDVLHLTLSRQGGRIEVSFHCNLNQESRLRGFMHTIFVSSPIMTDGGPKALRALDEGRGVGQPFQAIPPMRRGEVDA